MGKTIDFNKPLSEEDKAYLRERGREYLIPANERRFGEDGTREPDEHEQAGNHAISPFYQAEDRESAVYDVGGAPLPNTTLDYNTGRVQDRVNGVTVEYTGPGHTPGAYDLSPQRDAELYAGGFDDNSDGVSVDDQGNPVDDDIHPKIVEYVTELQNKAEIVKELVRVRALAESLGLEDIDTEYSGSDNREELENTLAVAMDDVNRKGHNPLPETQEENQEENQDGQKEAETENQE